MNNIFGRGVDVENFLHTIFQGGRGGGNGDANDDSPFARPATTSTSNNNNNNNHRNHHGPSPPASRTTLLQLPTIRVTPEDLSECPCNRECCICTEGLAVSNVVTRLPCAHLFHSDCVVDWLQRNNACPICRHELPTDSAEFEVGRLERMRNRPPRFAPHELARMTIAELKTLYHAKHTSVPRTIIDKQSLIDSLVQHHCIELIRSNNDTVEPVEYRLSELRQCTIKQLYTIMNDAGVYFDRKNVVERNDMVRIFVESGRLHVLPELPPAPRPTPPTVETVHSDDEDDDGEEENPVAAAATTTTTSSRQDTRRNADLVMEEASFVGQAETANQRQEPSSNHDGMDTDPSAAAQHLPSLIETMMHQAATLGMHELAMLQETISQLLEDRHVPSSGADAAATAASDGEYSI